MDDNNKKAQVSVSEETIAKTLRDHKDNYDHWLKGLTASSVDDDSKAVVDRATDNGITLQM